MAIIPLTVQHPWWRNQSELERIQGDINRLFDFTLSRFGGREDGLFERTWTPAVDILDSKDAFLLVADIPGMTREEIELTVHGDTVTIKGERKPAAGEGRVRGESFSGSFYRAVTLPVEVDAAKVSAVYKNGTLELTLPKKEEAKPRQIKIDVR